jgi:hypothetical protein
VTFYRALSGPRFSHARILSSLMILFLGWVSAGPRLYPQIAGGNVSGMVIDPSGASIPQAKLVLRNKGTRIARVLRANGEGFFAAPNLVPGDYEVTVSAVGFETQTAHITLTIGAEEEVNFALHIGSVDQSMEVEAPAPGVDLATSTVGAAVNQRAIQELPLNGRSWTDLAVLEPGVVPVEAQASYTAGNSRGNRGFGEQLAISGARPQQNDYRLDGISIDDYSNGGPGSVLGGNLGVDAIQEFSVFSANYSAAYGRASGGVINATTRSGTYDFHGSAYEFLRNSALDARNFFDKASAPAFRRNQFGAAAGGPLVRDRTFIFADFEAIRQSTGVTNVVTVPSPAARSGRLSTGDVAVDPLVAKYLAFYPLPNAGLLGKGDTGVFNFVGQQVANEDFVTARVDHRLSERDSLAGSYRFDRAQFTSPDSLNTELIGSNTRNQTAVVSENHIFSPAIMNSFRFGVNRAEAGNYESVSALIPEAGDLSLGAAPGRAAASVTVPGLTAFTGGLGGPGAYVFHYTSLQAYDDFFVTRGRHSLKLGLALERMRSNILALSNPNGQFVFGSLPGFLTNQPISLQIGDAQSLTPRGLRQTLAAAYFQDDWRMSSHLTVNLGVRYEMTTVPTEVNGKLSTLRAVSDATPHLGDPYFANPTLRNVEVRSGVSWDPFGDGKTAIRSGFGIYDVLPLTYEFELLSSLAAPFYELSGATALPAGSFPAKAVQFLGLSSLAQSYVEPHPHRDYVLQWNFNIQHNIARDLTVMLGYDGSRGVHQPFRTDDLNVVLPVSTPAGYLWPSPAGSGTVVNPDNGQIRGLFWDGSSVYNAMELRIVRKWQRGFQIQGSFTWSKSIDTGSSTLVGNAFSNAINGLPWYDLTIGRGVSDFNIPRVAVIQGIWAIPSMKPSAGLMGRLATGWQLSAILKASDGIPFTPLIAGDPLGEKSAAPFDFPDRLTEPGCGSAVNPGNPTHYIRTQCFTFPAPATLLGDAGRNILMGPGLVNLDLSLVKNTSIRSISDSFRAQFRMDIFNSFNRANFLPPLDNLKVFDATGQSVSSAGLLDATATSSRQIQFAIKLIW